MRFALLAALSALPLQWFLLAESPAGDIRVHQLAGIVLAAVIILRYGLPRIERGVRGAQLFIAANMYMIVLWVGLNVFNGVKLDLVLKQFIFLVVFVAVTALFYLAVLEGNNWLIDALRWSAAATVGVLLAAFGYSLLSNGVNPVDVLQRTIESGDPDILQKELFRTAFSGFGYDSNQEAIGNLRHEVFGGLLFSMYTAAWAVARRPFTEPKHRNIYRTAMVIGAGLLLISLSRSILVAAAIWPVLSFWRALLTGRVSPRQQLAVVAGLVGVAGLALTGFLEVIWTRFTEDTSSYATREDLIGLAFSRIADNFWVGGVQIEGTSSHNFVLDMWQRGGIFVGLVSVFIFLFISFLWLQELLRLRTSTDDAFVLAAALALPCVRLVTQGGGSMQIVEWMTLAFVIGVLTATRDKERAAAPPLDEPDKAAALLSPTQAVTLKRLRGQRAVPGSRQPETGTRQALTGSRPVETGARRPEPTG